MKKLKTGDTLDAVNVDTRFLPNLTNKGIVVDLPKNLARDRSIQLDFFTVTLVYRRSLRNWLNLDYLKFNPLTQGDPPQLLAPCAPNRQCLH